MFWLGVVLLVVGVAAVGTGVVLILVDVLDQVDDATSGTVTDATAQDDASDLGALVTLTVVGGMVMSLGIVLMVLGALGRRLGV
ncbi:MAG: hypothetical protein MUE78_03985 [Ilumatobacteraceae bacterium]|jgi:hypothetical protein|nr:hypothetical protein [Ilumatobacteraceae bacterium]